MNKPLFSIVLIMRNESAVLPRLLGSLKEFLERGGAVCITDTGSTDNSVEIAKSYGCNVTLAGDGFVQTLSAELADKINNQFIVGGEELIVKEGDRIFNFAEARNVAATAAKNDWVWAIDCDEQATILDIDKINEIISDPALSRLEYDFCFARDDFGNEVVRFMHSKMYRKDRMEWRGITHECLRDLEGGGDTRGKYIGPEILKLDHYQNKTTNRNGYMTGLALDLYLNLNQDRQSFYFARELMYKHRFKSAIREFERHAAMKGWLPERAQGLIYTGDCWRYLGDEEKMMEFYNKAFALDSSRREPLLRMAEFYFQKKDAQRTVAYAEAALTIPNSNFYANDQADYTFKPHEMLYWAYYFLNKKDLSAEHFKKCMEYMPLHPKFLHDVRFYANLPSVTVILPTLGRKEGLKRCLDSIEKLNYPKGLITVKVEEDEPRMGVPKRVKKMVDESGGEYICFAANDIEFTPESLVIAILTAKSRDKALVSFNTSGGIPLYEGNQCEHFIIRRDFLPQIGGEIFDTRYNHLGVDQLLWARCEKLKQAYRSKDAIVNHFHWAKGTGEFDEVAKLAWSEENLKHDRELLKEDLAKL